MIETWLTRLAFRLVDLSSRAVTWRRAHKRAFVMTADAVLAILATWLAFSLRLGEWRLLDWPVVRFWLTAIALWFPIALWRGIYNAIFRYSGRGAVVSLAAAMMFTGAGLVVIYSVFTYPGVPRTVAVLQPIFFLMMIATARIVGRYVLVDLFHARPIHGELRRVLIYGAGATGRQLANTLAGEAGTQLIGFIDDDPALAYQRLDGTPVWPAGAVGQLIENLGVTDVLLAMEGISFRQRQAVIYTLEQFSVSVKMLPPVRDFLEGRVTINSLRSIEVQDVLGREQVNPDEHLLKSAVTNKVVMVTGAGGSIGSEICRQVLSLGPSRLILVETSEFALFQIFEELRHSTPDAEISALLVNVSDACQVEAAITAHRPETLFHAAAFKHVPLVEENIVAGVRNNIFGTLRTACAADANGVERFILISTDKAVRPPNVMGATKRCCELVLQALAGRGTSTIFSIVRFGNVLNSSGSVVPRFRKQIAEGGPVTVTHKDVTRYFMTIPEAAQLVIQAGAMARGGEVFLLDMGEPVKIWDLAVSMIRLAGLTVRSDEQPAGDIEIVEVGLRLGEKLHEELLIGGNPLPTAHQRIHRGQEDWLPWDQLEHHLKALAQAVDAGDPDECRACLNRLVPTLPAEPSRIYKFPVPIREPEPGGRENLGSKSRQVEVLPEASRTS